MIAATTCGSSDSLADAPTDSSDLQHAMDLYERFDEELSSNLEEAREWIFKNCGSSQRMDPLMHLLGQMDFGDWLQLLGDLWCNCDNVGLYKDDLDKILKEWLDDPLTVIPELMSATEKDAFNALPDEIKIYRGCGPKNKAGMSWSLKREVAVRFPFNIRYWAHQPLLLTATIRKERAAALKLERNEHEIIVIDLPENFWTEEHISKPDA